MAGDPDELRILARKLAALTLEERGRVIAEATRDEIEYKPLPIGFKVDKRHKSPYRRAGKSAEEEELKMSE